MGSIIGHRIDYNRVGALRGQWHIPVPKLTQVSPRGNNNNNNNNNNNTYIAPISILLFSSALKNKNIKKIKK